PSVRGPRRRKKTCSLPATGLLPDCRQPSRDRCGRVIAPPIWFWPRARFDLLEHFRAKWSPVRVKKVRPANE
ncbi:hypothetical protein chiPu_0031100, partial [Chiloscyllium punctatum]|nr:hypothetical protein [Chiloscyllium punctatum]